MCLWQGGVRLSGSELVSTAPTHPTNQPTNTQKLHAKVLATKGEPTVDDGSALGLSLRFDNAARQGARVAVGLLMMMHERDAHPAHKRIVRVLLFPESTPPNPTRHNKQKQTKNI